MSIELNFPFTTPGNYYYNTSKIEVTGGIAKLKLQNTATNRTETFTSEIGYTYDSNKVEFTGGKAQLKLIDNTGQTFTQDFSSSSGFTYDSNKTEFVGGELRQKDQAPTDSLCWATYSSTVNLNVSVNGGSLTGTPIGGATVSGGKLNLTGESIKYVDYNADLNADSQQTGAIKFKLTPDYNGIPVSTKTFFLISKAASDTTNLISLDHSLITGQLRLQIKSQTDTVIIDANLGVWTPTSGTEYEFEINWDITTGATRLFINGTQFGTTQTGTGTRDSNIGLFRIGSNINAIFNSDFLIDDLIVFDAVQHTANYTPGYTLQVTRYLEDLITYPIFSYTGIGSIQAFTNFAVVQTDINKFNINGLYWNGASWVSSDDSYGQMNTASEITTNIGSLPASDTVLFKMRNLSSNTLKAIDNLILTYTGQIYPTDNPTIDIDSAITGTIQIAAWNSFTETTTELGSDLVKYVLSDDNGSTYKYWNGASWVTSSGYAQSNTGAEINSNIASLTVGAIDVKVKIYLHSNTGLTTPAIDTLVINYDDQSYPLDNPTIEGNASWRHEGLDGFTETSTKLGSDEIKYVLKKNGSWYYWTGSTWAISNETYSQANTASEIETNKATFTTIAISSKFKAFLHSDNGITTPEIDNLKIEYNFSGDNPDSPNTCIVWGYCKNIDGSIDTSPIIIYPDQDVIEYKENTQLLSSRITITPSSLTGYWEAELIITEDDQMNKTTQYKFEIGSLTISKAIPNVETINFNDL